MTAKEARLMTDNSDAYRLYSELERVMQRIKAHALINKNSISWITHHKDIFTFVVLNLEALGYTLDKNPSTLELVISW